MQYKSQSGRSMIEMLGVLAIIGVLSAGGIAGYTMAMQNYKTNKAMEMVQFVSTQAKTLYGSDYTGISANGMYSLGYVSSEFANATSSDGTSPFGSTWNITGNTSGFKISIGAVPPSACVKLSQAYWGDSTMFTELKSGSNSLANVTNTVTAADAITKCGTADATMEWVFK